MPSLFFLRAAFGRFGTMTIDRARRRLLGLRSPRPGEDGATPVVSVPLIDARLCNACDACVKVCGPGALRLGPGEAYYAIEPALCTDCGACVDVCDRLAIRLELDAAVALPARIALKVSRCPKCGEDFRSASPAASCRFCASPGSLRRVLRLQE